MASGFYEHTGAGAAIIASATSILSTSFTYLGSFCFLGADASDFLLFSPSVFFLGGYLGYLSSFGF